MLTGQSNIASVVDMATNMTHESADLDGFNLVSLATNNIIDNTNNGFNFLQTVLQRGNVQSQSDMLKIQKETEEFVGDIEIVSKSVSLGVKALDTLTRLQ